MDYRRSVKKNQASKYDFVKVKVYLSSQHYYVLSRFLLCRMLTAARIEYGHALRIALDLKKKLVDKPQLDVSQADLQVELFELIRQHGYSQQHVEWYKITAKFYHQRIPLAILLSGTKSTLKSTIATCLSERLNLSSVLKTDVIYNLIHTIKDGKIPDPIWSDPNLNKDDECHLVYKGLQGDVCKSVTDGKSIIIEGDLINHAVFDHLKMIADKAIWIPLLLVIKDCQIHQELLYREKDIEFERIRDWQDRLMKANAARDLDENTFHVIEVDVEDIQRTIDKIQSIVLDRIAHAVEAN